MEGGTCHRQAWVPEPRGAFPFAWQSRGGGPWEFWQVWPHPVGTPVPVPPPTLLARGLPPPAEHDPFRPLCPQEVCTLLLAAHLLGDQISLLNWLGFALCLSGISLHVALKALHARGNQAAPLPPRRPDS